MNKRDLMFVMTGNPVADAAQYDAHQERLSEENKDRMQAIYDDDNDLIQAHLDMMSHHSRKYCEAFKRLRADDFAGYGKVMADLLDKEIEGIAEGLD